MQRFIVLIGMALMTGGMKQSIFNYCVSFMSVGFVLLVQPVGAESSDQGVTASPVSQGPGTIEAETCKAQLRDDGTISSLQFRDGDKWIDVQFRSDTKSGPKWAGVEVRAVDSKAPRYEGIKDNIRYSVEYGIQGKSLVVTACIKNESTVPFAPDVASLIMGLDAEMTRYPEWNNLYFPTFLRCEKTQASLYLGDLSRKKPSGTCGCGERP
jgi:hypothetical protein